MCKCELLIILLIVCLTCGCQRSQVNKQLDLAEAVMEEHPDSALVILEEIDGGGLRGESQARHALLLSQAYDKNYIDLTSDSLISIAVNYYLDSDDEYHKMLSQYYWGLVCHNAMAEKEALYNALRANDIAVARNDTLNMCRTFGLIGRIYRTSYNFQSAYEWHKRSLKLAKLLQRQDWMMASYYNIAESSLYLQRFEESLANADSASMLSLAPDFDILEVQYLANHCLGDFSRADSIYSEIISNGFNPPSGVIAGHAMLHPDNALELLDNYVRENNIEPYSEADIAIAYALSYLKSGQIEKAAEAIEQHTLGSNYLLSQMGDNSLEKVHLNFARQKIEQEKELRISARNLFLGLCVVVALVLIIALMAILLLRNREKSRQTRRERDLLILNNKLSLITARLSESESEISEKQDIISSLEKQISEINTRQNVHVNNEQETVSLLTEEIAALKKDTYKLFVQQFSLINKVGTVGFKTQISGLPKETGFDQIVSELETLTNDKAIFRSIESIISMYNSELKCEIEKLALLPSEYELVTYRLFGLSTQVIALLMNKSERAVYNLKSRIKKKISETNTASSVEILRDFI